MSGTAPTIVPAAPEHGQQITWFEVLDLGYAITVEEPCATYHKFTAWKDYAPQHAGGKDIENEWMVKDGGRASTEHLRRMVDGRAGQCFATRPEAVAAARERIAQARDSYRKRLADLDECERLLEGT